MDNKNQYLSTKTTWELKELLKANGVEIESILSHEDLSIIEKNQIALTYHNEQKLPFLLGHKIKYIPNSDISIDVLDGIMIGILAINKDTDIEKRYIFDEKTGEVHHVFVRAIVYPTKRINCHPEIKQQLELFVGDKNFDQSLLLVPHLPLPQSLGTTVDTDNASSHQSYMKPKLFTRDDTRIPWYELVDTTQPLFRQIESLFRLFTTFEEEEEVLPIAVGASCQPSAISNYTQISVFYGFSGTGKSACCHLVEGLYDIPKVLSSITYAGFRNHVEQYRELIHTEYTGERNIHIVIDEISSDTLANNDFYVLLKGGVSIATSDIRISSEKSGENQTFNCFCPKSFSTCNPFWQQEKYNEIRRRIFVFETKQMPNPDFFSKEEINYNECDQKLSKVLQDFWAVNQERYKQIVRKLRGDDRDILATISCIYDIEPDNAKKMLKRFRGLTRDKTHKPDARIEYLDAYLEAATLAAATSYINAKYEYGIEDHQEFIKVKASDLTAHFKQGASLGIFDRSLADSKAISELMTARGFELKHTREGGMLAADSWFWVKQYQEGGQ